MKRLCTWLFVVYSFLLAGISASTDIPNDEEKETQSYSKRATVFDRCMRSAVFISVLACVNAALGPKPVLHQNMNRNLASANMVAVRRPWIYHSERDTSLSAMKSNKDDYGMDDSYINGIRNPFVGNWIDAWYSNEQEGESKSMKESKNDTSKEEAKDEVLEGVVVPNYKPLVIKKSPYNLSSRKRVNRQRSSRKGGKIKKIWNAIEDKRKL